MLEEHKSHADEEQAIAYMRRKYTLPERFLMMKETIPSSGFNTAFYQWIRDNTGTLCS